MRVRWAFEEVGQPYDVQFVTFDELESAEYLSLHPFGYIPVYQKDGLVLFDSSAIIFQLAESYPGLFPKDSHARARVISWMFAAVNTIEPPVLQLEVADLVEQDKSWYQKRLPFLKDQIREVFGDLVRFLGKRDWLEQEFSAADIIMVLVLRRAEGTGLLEEFPKLVAYINRGVSRPAYQRAFAEQLAVFKANQ